MDTGSRQENASKQKSRAPFRFNRNGKGSDTLIGRHTRSASRQLNALSAAAKDLSREMPAISCSLDWCSTTRIRRPMRHARSRISGRLRS
ncbi:hypothetical protein FDV58_20630 [Bradyrhizobium elkanii]|uniref:Uncharacterized protein n=1 Tax=Bradyrhizobium elkanii TaxID=29448 RepID=A0A4U6RWK0_BRAEL|nr:hypothetical protein [Bradyrhizobium sp. BR2003]TKV79577.1 hypothetical protein FDV58_20630 [Bradyrhizobium elkanii]